MFYFRIPFFSGVIDKIAETVDLAGRDVLCVGCRNIAEIEYFRSKGAKQVIGIDLYSESQDILVMDMHHMRFTDNRFDVVYASHSLEHAFDVRKVVGEMVRVARHGELIGIEVPVHYETRDADLIDFDNIKALHAAFEPFIERVLWLEEAPVFSPRNEHGTDIIRTLFSVQKRGTTGQL